MTPPQILMTTTDPQR